MDAASNIRPSAQRAPSPSRKPGAARADAARLLRLGLPALALVLAAAAGAAPTGGNAPSQAVAALPAPGTLPPSGVPILPLDELRAGQAGTVWTVFQGTQPEPFAVEVTGVIRNALGPGRSLILCRLTDPRVQEMGAVAGMSGSPLYVGGRLAGALSYQLQRFETVHYAGFTPAADLLDVEGRTAAGPAADAPSPPALPPPGLPAPAGPYRLLKPELSLGGLSPEVARLFSPRLESLGFACDGLSGGADSAAAPPESDPARRLGPGDAAAVALCVGDITLAATGTVFRVDGKRLVAFGHPMLGLGSVDLPLCSASIVAILPSTQESIKVADIGPVIGRITQDRLSGVSGTLGETAGLTDVEVAVDREQGPPRVLRFRVIRQEMITPTLVAAGVTQAILGSNDAGLAQGFRLAGTVTFPGAQSLRTDALYAGPQAFALGLAEFLQGLSAALTNPFERVFPTRIAFTATPLTHNPAALIDRLVLSRTRARAGDTVVATLGWRDYQGASHTETVPIRLDPAWAGRTVEIVAGPGPALDELVGRGPQPPPGQVRTFPAYLDFLRQQRPPDGITLAVLEQTDLFSDQSDTTAELPASLARIAHADDAARFRTHRALVPLWETRLLPGRLADSLLRRPLDIVN